MVGPEYAGWEPGRPGKVPAHTLVNTAGSFLGAVMRNCLWMLSWPNTTSMSATETPNKGARKRTMWSVALPFFGVAVTLTLSCVPMGLAIASQQAEGLPRMLTINTSPSQAKKESPVALRGAAT